MTSEPDDPMHEHALLASAYLDGEATSDERALVETSQETLDALASMSRLREVLTATAPVASLSDREAHLANALDLWERMSDRERVGDITPGLGIDGAAAAALQTPVSSSASKRDRSGRRSSRRSEGGIRSITPTNWVLGAAATLLMLAGVAAVVNSVTGPGDTADDVALEQPDARADLSEVEQNEIAEVAGENVGENVDPDPEAIEDEAQTDGGGLFSEDQANVNPSDAETSAASADASSDSAAEPGTQPSPGSEIARVQLESTEDLADYGSLVVAAASGGPSVTSDIDFEAPGESCEAVFGIEQLLEPASYRGVDVFVGVDLGSDTVYAYDDDCTLIESAPLASR